MTRPLFIQFIAFLIAFIMSAFSFKVMAQDESAPMKSHNYETTERAEDAADSVTALSEPVASTDTYDMYGSMVDSWESATGISGMMEFKAEAESEKSAEKEGSNEGEKQSEKAQKQHLFKGDVTKVCQSKGCNFYLVDGDEQVRIRFKDYSFFIPTNSAGRKAVVRGHYMLKEQDDAEPVVEFLADGIVLFK